MIRNQTKTDIAFFMESSTMYKFAVVPKQLSSPFFEVVGQGCHDRARKRNVECLFVGTQFPDADGQAALLRNFTEAGVDGIAVSVVNNTSPAILSAIADAIYHNIPVITFDSDAPASKRLSYLGSNNWAMGDLMGKILLQINPLGGYFGIISNKAQNGPEREAGIRRRLMKSSWQELPSSPADSKESEVLSLQHMESFMQDAAGRTLTESVAIISVGGWPMRNTTLWMDFIDRYPNITTICADTLPHQMDLMNRGYVTGLVGQVPYLMGANSIDTLLAYLQNEVLPDTMLGTSLQEVITVPLDLPPVDLETHHIGKLIYAGFSVVTIVVIMAVGSAYWTWHYRKNKAVQASQPMFLLMIAMGVLIMSASIIPMSIDDGNFLPPGDTRFGIVACMSQVWLLSIGFTTIFAALFSKTWRINTVVHSTMRFQKVLLSARDVVLPLAVLLALNIIVLLSFTILSPLEFIRQDHAGMDAWNRVISTYGTCRSSGITWPYFTLLALVNSCALLFALVQAYKARSIQSELAESQYIAIVMLSYLQIIVIGAPILFMVETQPEVLYVLKVGIVFLASAVVILCIFFPKMRHVHGVLQPSGTPPRIAPLERPPAEQGRVPRGEEVESSILISEAPYPHRSRNSDDSLEDVRAATAVAETYLKRVMRNETTTTDLLPSN